MPNQERKMKRGENQLQFKLGDSAACSPWEGFVHINEQGWRKGMYKIVS